MDWDNTIRRGWTIRDWALHLENRGLVSKETVANVEAILKRYALGRCTYPVMANTVLEAMARGLRGQSAAAIAAQAPLFVEGDRDNLYPFAPAALRELRARGLELVVVSGAPEEVLDAAAQEYGFSEIYGSAFDVRNDEYIGTVARNRATVEGKIDVVGLLFDDEGAELAIGDSEADLPLLERARLKIVVGNPKLARQVPGGLWIEPENPDIAPLLNAVDAA